MVDNNFTDKSKIIADKNGRDIVVIDEIRFKGKYRRKKRNEQPA